jgi:linoleoyl-CoA desaturase
MKKRHMMPTRPQSFSRRLTTAEKEAFGTELEALRKQVLQSLGEKDARYVHRLHSVVRWTGLGGRMLLVGGFLPPVWVAGTLSLALSKILENMELGHNVLHGQYDFMNDPELSSRSYEWDNVCPSDAWRHSHNYVHHAFTNVIGRDRDLGYGLLRLFPEQPWHPGFIFQPFYALALALSFEWGLAVHDVELNEVLRGNKPLKRAAAEMKPVARKAARQLLKDYVVFPALAGPCFVPVLLGNAAANLTRNVWAFSIIFCGHFTAGVEAFPEAVLENETRAEWYLRQLKGSSNLDGGPLFHVLTGNLSHQIEHHLFPDVPAHHYSEISGEVKTIAAKYGQNYDTGSLSRQFATVLGRIFKHSLPQRPSLSNELGSAQAGRPSASPSYQSSGWLSMLARAARRRKSSFLPRTRRDCAAAADIPVASAMSAS